MSHEIHVSLVNGLVIRSERLTNDHVNLAVWRTVTRASTPEGFAPIQIGPGISILVQLDRLAWFEIVRQPGLGAASREEESALANDMEVDFVLAGSVPRSKTGSRDAAADDIDEYVSLTGRFDDIPGFMDQLDPGTQYRRFLEVRRERQTPAWLNPRGIIAMRLRLV